MSHLYSDKNRGIINVLGELWLNIIRDRSKSAFPSPLYAMPFEVSPARSSLVTSLLLKIGDKLISCIDSET